MRPITDILREIRKGRVVERASEEMAEVVRAVLDTEKAGKLTIELTVKPQGKGDSAVIVSAKLKTTIPQADLPDALFFADLDGDLHRDDPSQREMFTPTDALGDTLDRKGVPA